MTREEYGTAYEKGFPLTVRFLMSRGLSYDTATETAQAAWAKGWDRLSQLRDDTMILTWMNSIALNIFRSHLRREPFIQQLPPDMSVLPKVNLAAMDVKRLLNGISEQHRLVLTRHYLEERKVSEIAALEDWTETTTRIRLLRARRKAFNKFSEIECARSRKMKKDSQSTTILGPTAAQAMSVASTQVVVQAVGPVPGQKEFCMVTSNPPEQILLRSGERIYIAGVSPESEMKIADESNLFARIEGHRLAKEWSQDLGALIMTSAVQGLLRFQLVDTAKEKGLLCVGIPGWRLKQVNKWLAGLTVVQDGKIVLSPVLATAPSEILERGLEQISNGPLVGEGLAEGSEACYRSVFSTF